jgi:hypothetical protein
MLMLLLAAACGDDDSITTLTFPTSTTGASTTSTTGGTTTTGGTPTTSGTTTATTVPETTIPVTTVPLYLIDPTDFFPDVFGSSGDPHGSGCVVGGGDALPGGVWFGFAEGVAGGTISFDLACFFTGDAAAAAATADGEEVFDFYIRNQNPKVYSVPISSSAQVYYVDMITGPDPTPIALSSWPTSASFQSCPSDHCAVWLYVNGGVATGIVEQYLP